MRLTFLPKTILGKLSVVISIVFIILMWAKIQYSIHLPTFTIAALGLIGFIVSIVAIFKNKDRSILNLLPFLLGLLIISWAVAELTSPH
jgi:hypothetical protein